MRDTARGLLPTHFIKTHAEPAAAPLWNVGGRGCRPASSTRTSGQSPTSHPSPPPCTGLRGSTLLWKKHTSVRSVRSPSRLQPRPRGGAHRPGWQPWGLWLPGPPAPMPGLVRGPVAGDAGGDTVISPGATSSGSEAGVAGSWQPTHSRCQPSPPGSTSSWQRSGPRSVGRGGGWAGLLQGRQPAAGTPTPNHSFPGGLEPPSLGKPRVEPAPHGPTAPWAQPQTRLPFGLGLATLGSAGGLRAYGFQARPPAAALCPSPLRECLSGTPVCTPQTGAPPGSWHWGLAWGLGSRGGLAGLHTRAWAAHFTLHWAVL